jgi:hypothetical protein
MARERKFIKSEGDKRFDDIERALQLMSAKLFKTTTVVIPPIPLSCAMKLVPADGEIFRGFFRTDGLITSLCAFCEAIAKGGKPTVKVKVFLQDGTSHQTELALRSGFSMSQVEFPMPALSRVIMTVTDPESITGLWFCATYEVEIKSAAMHALAIDDLVANIDAISGFITSSDLSAKPNSILPPSQEALPEA